MLFLKIVLLTSFALLTNIVVDNNGIKVVNPMINNKLFEYTFENFFSINKDKIGHESITINGKA